MGAQLRVVLDQVDAVVDPAEAEASLALVAGLVATAPVGCSVAAIVAARGAVEIAGIDEVRVLGRGRKRLAAAWRLGFGAGVGRGLIHAPTLMAPLVKHDRLHDNDQTVATIWDLRAWERPEALPKSTVAWQRGMLRRAVRHADAVVVPSHAMAARLGALAGLGDRIRVIAGAPPGHLSVPSDAARRRADLFLPAEYVVLSGDEADLATGFRATAAREMHAVVLDAPEGAEPRLAERAVSAGLDERRVHVRGDLELGDRAAVLAGAGALVATSTDAVWPWRVVEAMTLGVPVVAAASDVHRDVISDGGSIVAPEDLPEALEAALGPDAARLRVLGQDRARAFSWASTGERVWALHADL